MEIIMLDFFVVLLLTALATFATGVVVALMFTIEQFICDWRDNKKR